MPEKPPPEVVELAVVAAKRLATKFRATLERAEDSKKTKKTNRKKKGEK